MSSRKKEQEPLFAPSIQHQSPIVRRPRPPKFEIVMSSQRVAVDQQPNPVLDCYNSGLPYVPKAATWGLHGEPELSIRKKKNNSSQQDHQPQPLYSSNKGVHFGGLENQNEAVAEADDDDEGSTNGSPLPNYPYQRSAPPNSNYQNMVNEGHYNEEEEEESDGEEWEGDFNEIKDEEFNNRHQQRPPREIHNPKQTYYYEDGDGDEKIASPPPVAENRNRKEEVQKTSSGRSGSASYQKKARRDTSNPNLFPPYNYIPHSHRSKSSSQEQQKGGGVVPPHTKSTSTRASQYSTLYSPMMASRLQQFRSSSSPPAAGVAKSSVSSSSPIGEGQNPYHHHHHEREKEGKNNINKQNKKTGASKSSSQKSRRTRNQIFNENDDDDDDEVEEGREQPDEFQSTEGEEKWERERTVREIKNNNRRYPKNDNQDHRDFVDEDYQHIRLSEEPERKKNTLLGAHHHQHHRHERGGDEVVTGEKNIVVRREGRSKAPVQYAYVTKPQVIEGRDPGGRRSSHHKEARKCKEEGGRRSASMEVFVSPVHDPSASGGKNNYDEEKEGRGHVYPEQQRRSHHAVTGGDPSSNTNEGLGHHHHLQPPLPSTATVNYYQPSQQEQEKGNPLGGRWQSEEQPNPTAMNAYSMNHNKGSAGEGAGRREKAQQQQRRRMIVFPPSSSSGNTKEASHYPPQLTTTHAATENNERATKGAGDGSTVAAQYVPFSELPLQQAEQDQIRMLLHQNSDGSNNYENAASNSNPSGTPLILVYENAPVLSLNASTITLVPDEEEEGKKANNSTEVSAATSQQGELSYSEVMEVLPSCRNSKYPARRFVPPLKHPQDLLMEKEKKREEKRIRIQQREEQDEEPGGGEMGGDFSLESQQDEGDRYGHRHSSSAMNTQDSTPVMGQEIKKKKNWSDQVGTPIRATKEERYQDSKKQYEEYDEEYDYRNDSATPKGHSGITSRGGQRTPRTLNRRELAAIRIRQKEVNERQQAASASFFSSSQQATATAEADAAGVETENKEKVLNKRKVGEQSEDASQLSFLLIPFLMSAFHQRQNLWMEEAQEWDSLLSILQGIEREQVRREEEKDEEGKFSDQQQREEALHFLEGQYSQTLQLAEELQRQCEEDKAQLHRAENEIQELTKELERWRRREKEEEETSKKSKEEKIVNYQRHQGCQVSCVITAQSTCQTETSEEQPEKKEVKQHLAEAQSFISSNQEDISNTTPGKREKSEAEQQFLTPQHQVSSRESRSQNRSGGGSPGGSHSPIVSATGVSLDGLQEELSGINSSCQLETLTQKNQKLQTANRELQMKLSNGETELQHAFAEFHAEREELIRKIQKLEQNKSTSHPRNINNEEEEEEENHVGTDSSGDEKIEFEKQKLRNEMKEELAKQEIELQRRLEVGLESQREMYEELLQNTREEKWEEKEQEEVKRQKEEENERTAKISKMISEKDFDHQQQLEDLTVRHNEMTNGLNEENLKSKFYNFWLILTCKKLIHHHEKLVHKHQEHVQSLQMALQAEHGEKLTVLEQRYESEMKEKIKENSNLKIEHGKLQLEHQELMQQNAKVLSDVSILKAEKDGLEHELHHLEENCEKKNSEVQKKCDEQFEETATRAKICETKEAVLKQVELDLCRRQSEYEENLEKIEDKVQELERCHCDDQFCIENGEAKQIILQHENEKLKRYVSRYKNQRDKFFERYVQVDPDAKGGVVLVAGQIDALRRKAMAMNKSSKTSSSQQNGKNGGGFPHDDDDDDEIDMVEIKNRIQHHEQQQQKESVGSSWEEKKRLADTDEDEELEEGEDTSVYLTGGISLLRRYWRRLFYQWAFFAVTKDRLKKIGKLRKTEKELRKELQLRGKSNLLLGSNSMMVTTDSVTSPNQTSTSKKCLHEKQNLMTTSSSEKLVGKKNIFSPFSESPSAHSSRIPGTRGGGNRTRSRETEEFIPSPPAASSSLFPPFSSKEKKSHNMIKRGAQEEEIGMGMKREEDKEEKQGRKHHQQFIALSKEEEDTSPPSLLPSSDPVQKPHQQPVVLLELSLSPTNQQRRSKSKEGMDTSSPITKGKMFTTATAASVSSIASLDESQHKYTTATTSTTGAISSSNVEILKQQIAQEKQKTRVLESELALSRQVLEENNDHYAELLDHAQEWYEELQVYHKNEKQNATAIVGGATAGGNGVSALERRGSSGRQEDGEEREERLQGMKQFNYSC